MATPTTQLGQPGGVASGETGPRAARGPGSWPLVAPVCGAAVMLVGVVYVAAWLLGEMAAQGLAALTMKTNAALCLVLLGGALLLLVREDPGPRRRWAARLCAGPAVVIGALTLSENVAGWDLGIDQLLATEIPGALGIVSPNRMGTPASTAFSLAGIALLLLARRRPGAQRWAQRLSLIVCLAGLLPLVGYLYGVDWLHRVAGVTAIAWPTALCLLALGAGTLCARPAEALMAQVTVGDAGGAMIRRLLLPVLTMPIVLGGLAVAGVRHGPFDMAEGTALLMITFVVSLAVLTWRAGRQGSRAAAELGQQRELLAVTLRSIGDALLACDADRRIRFVNAAAAALTGWTAEEAEGRPIGEVFRIVDEGTGAPAEDIVGRALREGQTVELANHTALVTRGGARVPIEDSVAPIRDARGRVAGAVLVFHDVTEKRRAVDELRRFQLAIQQTRDAIFFVGCDDGRIREASAAAGTIYGYTREELLRLTVHDLRAPDATPDVAAQMGEADARGVLFETLHRRKDGSVFPVEVSSRGADVGGQRVLVSVVRDITERRRAQASEREQREAAERRADELREADRRKNEFLAVLSHELRNPLAPIRNGLHVLTRAGPGSEQARRVMAIIERQVAQLGRLIDDLLDITRISRGKIRLQRERLRLDDVVRAAGEDHRELFRRDGLELVVAVPPRPLHADADRTRIAQVVGNLLQNAAKFTPRGGRARVSLEDGGDGQALIEVSDTGAGIDPHLLARLFEPFVQADETLDRSRGGLGLGLALVKALVELHGGSVAVRSDGPGTGATFTVRLPLAPVAEVRPAQGAPPPAGAGRSRILVVEDNEDAAWCLKEALEQGGHEVDLAATGTEGVEKARATRPDVILCDLGLPGLDGFAVVRAVRADPGLRGTLVVALSGYASADDVERALAAGFDRHMAKPADVSVLVGLLSGAHGP